MGHKIHPSGLRLGITQEHRSKWFATSKTYPVLLQEDFKIRTFIQKKYGAAGISDVLIARKADQLELELKTAISHGNYVRGSASKVRRVLDQIGVGLIEMH